jgi:hypothetical protein
MKKVSAGRVLLFYLLLATPAAGAPITIDFEDAVGHDVMLPPSHYLGVTITNGVWIRGANLPFGTFNQGSGGLGVDLGLSAINNWAFPGVTSPIVISFSAPVANVSIQAFDVGANGAQIRAFDASDLLLGTASAVGVGIGTGNHPLLSLSAINVSRLELIQHLYPSGGSDGLGWDNLTFEPSLLPGPSSTMVLLTGLALGLFSRHRWSPLRDERFGKGRMKAVVLRRPGRP